MIVLMWLTAAGLLLAACVVWLVYFSGRKWPLKWRLLAIVVGELAILAIPFWNLIPANYYFNTVCKDAGLHMLSDKGAGLKERELDFRSTNKALPFHITEWVDFVSRKSDGAPVAVLRVFRMNDGHGGYVKPWLSKRCPALSSKEASQITPQHVLRRELARKLKATQ